jgi:hypothetical protein
VKGDHDFVVGKCRWCDAELGTAAATRPCPGLAGDELRERHAGTAERRAELDLADRIEAELRRPTPGIGAGRRKAWDD